MFSKITPIPLELDVLIRKRKVEMDSKYTNVLEQIDRLHAQDPNKIVIEQKEVPYELHYSNKMTSYLEKRDPSASPVLRLAVRAQHLCRWEVPRDSYPMTRVGYL